MAGILGVLRALQGPAWLQELPGGSQLWSFWNLKNSATATTKLQEQTRI